MNDNGTVTFFYKGKENTVSIEWYLDIAEYKRKVDGVEEYLNGVIGQ